MPETLVILTPGFPANEADTACLPPQQVFIRALKSACPHLQIIILSFQYPFETKEYEWEGVKIIAFGGKGKGGLYRRFIWIRVWRRLNTLNRAHNVIGLLSFWLGETAFVASRFARKRNLIHRSWLLGQDARAGNNYVARIKPDAGELIAISDFVTHQYKKNYAVAPAHVIPIGVYPSSFDTDDDKRDIDILGAGSLIPLKQYHVFVEVINELKKTQPGIKATICGDGPEMGKLKRMIAEFGLEENIVLKGELPHQEVIKLMQRSAILLHPSNYEGFSTVCLEALAAGASVISFIKPMDAGMPKWFIANDKQEMLNAALTILGKARPDHSAVLPYPVAVNARAIMKLFNYKE
jgi:glycosyltransferase involved in cell wall biosynthesis